MDLTQYLLSNSKNVNASSQELTNEKDSRIVNVSGFRWYSYMFLTSIVINSKKKDEPEEDETIEIDDTSTNKNLYILIKS